MIVSLYIENYILIEKLHLNFNHGLVVLTGETGVGKSIILGALSLVLGARGDSKAVRQSASSANISATIEPSSMIKKSLQDIGIDDDDELLILRRQITADGKSRCFINDRPVNLQTLKQIGNDCADIQGQFDNRGLLDIATHGQILDIFAAQDPSHQKLLQQYQQSYHAWQKQYNALQEMQKNAEASQQQYGFLSHITQELEKLAAQDGEYEDLRQQRHHIKHHAKRQELVQEMSGYFHGEHNIRQKLNKIAYIINNFNDFAITQGQKMTEACALAIEQCDTIESLLQDVVNDNKNQYDREKIDTRFFALQDCAKKYQLNPNELASALEKYQESLAMINDGGATLKKRQEECDILKNNSVAIGKKLSQSRQKHAQILSGHVTNELAYLHMENAIFNIDIASDDTTTLNINGIDNIIFTAATNKNMGLSPLHKTASGGELSRILLALSICLGDGLAIPCLIFDEIDQGVGGATAAAIGERLHQLAKNTQVIMITHSPQVAAAGDQHILLHKHDDGNSTQTNALMLDTAQRREEIARMLSGADINDAARAAADELLKVNLS